MNYIKVKNKEDLNLKLLFKGENYTLDAKETKSFPEDVAKQWITIYEFLSIDNTKDVVKEEKEIKDIKEVKVNKK